VAVSRKRYKTDLFVMEDYRIICNLLNLAFNNGLEDHYTFAHGSGRRYYILLLKFLSFFLFFLSPQDLRDGATDREPF